MNKSTMETNKTITTNELKNALKIVHAAIKTKEDAYRMLASSEDQGPILLEGRTAKGYYCQIMVDPKEVAEIFLEHNYAVWSTLEEEPPIAMWDDLARFYGLESVCSVDL